MRMLWLLLWCCECEKSCRLTAVGFMCSAACAVCRGGMQYVVLRHFMSCVGRSVGFTTIATRCLFGLCSTI